MRVSFATSGETMLRNINRKNEEINSLSYQLSSGLRMARSADDPVAWAKAMDLKTKLNDLDVYSTNINFAKSWNTQTEDALSQIQEVVVSAKNIAISSINGANSTASAAANVEALNKLIAEAVPLANQQYQGRYLFSVNSGTEPFDLATDLSSVTGPVDTTVLTDELNVRVGAGQSFTANVDGEKAFLTTDAAGQPSNIFQELIVLRDAIQANDTAAISQQMDILDTGRDQLSQQISVAGTNLSSLQGRKDALDSLKTDVKTQLSDTEDVDYADALTQWKQKSTVLEAALQITGMMDDLNLSKYI